MIGSPRWLVEAEAEYRRMGWPFEPTRAYRRDTLREVAAQRPRRWNGALPLVLHDRADRSALNPRFVAYLDTQFSLYTWEGRFKVLKHQPLQWWADRLAEIGNEGNPGH